MRLSSMKKIIETIDSLNGAIKEAGGTEKDISQLEKMSVTELFNLIGPNDIRFVFVGREEEGNIRLEQLCNFFHENYHQFPKSRIKLEEDIWLWWKSRKICHTKLLEQYSNANIPAPVEKIKDYFHENSETWPPHKKTAVDRDL